MQKMGKKAIFLIGISGCGKSTLIKNLKAHGFCHSISYTTRPPREGETNGVHYHFVTQDEFLHKANDGFFLEYKQVHGSHYYGTSHEDIARLCQEGQSPVKDIDIQGRLEIKHLPYVMSIYLDLPIEKLTERLLQRGEKDFETRLETAKKEIPLCEEHCSYRIDACLSPDEVTKKFLEIAQIHGTYNG